MTTEQLLEEVGQLPNDKLEEFMRQVIHMAASRRYPALPPREVELLRKINGEPNAERVRRYRVRRTIRRDDSLSAEETHELLELSDRLKAIADLAKLRKLSLPEMMLALSI